MDYWKECIAEAFDDAGIKATGEQVDTVASWVEGAHENYGMATGLDVASQNFISDEARGLEQIKAEHEKKRLYELSTTPCKDCTTTGSVKDGWGRDQECGTCRGKGRHK